MARLSTFHLLLTLLFVGLLAEQGFCRPSKEESSDADEYLNDDYDEDADEEQQYTGPPPSMISTPLEIEVHEGDTVALPCETTNLSELLDVFASVWKKNSDHIFTDGLRKEGLDDRIMYYKPNNSLVIHNITKEDAGTFVCLIFFSPALEVKHVVHVFAPAAVKSIEPPSHVQVLKKGAPLNLKCNVTGYPRPAVKWVKKGKHETGEGIVLTTEPNLILNSVDRRDSGVYECIAENDQGPKASASVTVRINYIPEISVEEDLVATGEGYDATLKCVVHAEPKANIEWVYNTDPISPSDRVLFSQQGHTHILEIKKVEPKDFGKYTCRATNNQGSEVSKVIELTGKPNIPHFISAIVGPDGKSLNVELEIISYSPMMEYKLLYKQLDKGNHSWITVKTPVVDPEGSTLFKVKHTLQDLPVGDYVVSFRARNGFGWSNQARPYAFTIKETSHENHEATAETSKMEESGNGDLNNDSTRPRLMAVLTIISLSSFFL